MKRIGIFTGKVYEGNFNINEITECCKMVSDETASNSNLVKFIHLTEKQRCEGCFDCEASKRLNKQ